MTTISIIVAAAKNGVIGFENNLPWDIPKDMAWFRDKTRAKPVIMGSKTHESIGRLLPKRPNIVITRGHRFDHVDDLHVAHSIEEALNLDVIKDHQEAFVIGGGQIYKESLEKNLIDKIYITDIEKEYKGDAFFPSFDRSKWRLSFEEKHVNEKDDTPFVFRIYEKKTA